MSAGLVDGQPDHTFVPLLSKKAPYEVHHNYNSHASCLLWLRPEYRDIFFQ
jgi:hypothetical protein